MVISEPGCARLNFLPFGLGLREALCNARRTLTKTISEATRETKPKYKENRRANQTIADLICVLDQRQCNIHCFVKDWVHSWVSRVLETGTLLGLGKCLDERNSWVNHMLETGTQLGLGTCLDGRIRSADLVNNVILDRPT